MCGISLILDIDGKLAGLGMPEHGQDGYLASVLAPMQAQQQHRGPDSGGTYILPWGNGSIALGSRRLQILDVSQAADQPMQASWSGKKGWLSYNGEIYNWADLRNELLQLGCTFSTRSDTEVVLLALLQWGNAALQRFNGMFALAYYEQAANGNPTLLLARDRWGQKPLYYARSDRSWVVASELQGILASGLVKKRLNQQQLLHYLQFKYAKRPQTFFQDIYELEPGHYLLLKLQQEQAVEQKFSPPLPALLPAPADNTAVLPTLDELLTDSLIGQLQSDKPVGLFLSGGVDSTLMLAMLRQHAPGQVPVCYTIGTETEDKNWGTADYSWAQKAAKQYGAYHQPLSATAASVLERFGELARSQDQPIADGAWLLSCLLSEHASARVKVVLSGAGADEQFAGYHRHSAFATYLQHQNWLSSLLPILKGGSKLLPTGRGVPGRKQWQLLQKFAGSLGADPYQTFLNFTSLSIPGSEVGAIAPKAAQPNPLQWALEHDRQQYLVSDILALNDKAGMQASLEMRMPYLDAPLTDYVAQLPAEYLLKGGRKWLLKALLQQYDGKAYTGRRKEGFGMPFGAWIQAGQTDFLWQWLHQKEHPLHTVLPTSITQDLLQAHRQGKADYTQELMALALLAPWLEKHF